MTPKTRLRINLATVLALGILMVGWVVTQVVSGGVTTPVRVVADFAQSGGVFTNQEVTYRGVLVGKIGDLSLNEGGVDIELLLDPEWDDRIPEDVIASVQSKSAVGEQFVNLTPVSSDGPRLTDGDRIAREATKLPVDFQKLLRSLDRVLGDIPPATTRSVVEELADGLRGRSSDIATILRSLGELADSFADVGPEQQRLLSNATETGRAFLSTKDEFARAVRAADDVLRAIGDEPEEQRELFAANDRLAREGIDLLARRGDDLAGGIESLADFVHLQYTQQDEIIRSLEYIPQFLHAVEDAAVPWQDPDGDRYFRLRVGLVHDNVESSWPCKYVLPEDYERFPHEREPKKLLTNQPCEPSENADALARSLLAALQSQRSDVTESLPLAVIAEEVPSFIWPAEGPITSPYGDRDGVMHWGIDIGADLGAPVVASAAGIVSHAGPMSGFGRLVIIDHGGGVETLYAHLSETAVVFGQPVTGGQMVGSVGCSGDCTGEHLHFEVHLDDEPVDPLTVLPGGPLFAPASPYSRPPRG